MPTNLKKVVRLDNDAQDKMKQGINLVANAVGSTLGAKGKTVMIRNTQYSQPYLTKDGVTVAREIHLEDPIMDMGVQLVKEASLKLNKAVGDGTSSSLVILQSLINNQVLPTKETLDAVYNNLEELKQEVTSYDDLYNIAKVSANGDHEVATLASEVVWKMGKNGLVNVFHGKDTEDSVDYMEGIYFDRGYTSPYFVTDPERDRVEYEDVLIIVCDKKVTNIFELQPILGLGTDQPLLIIVPHILEAGMKTLVTKRSATGQQICVVRAPDFGNRMKDMLQDIAIITGAGFLTEEKGMGLESFQTTHLGAAKKIVITADSTTIIGGYGDKEDIAQRKAQIENRIKEGSKDEDHLKARLSFFGRGVANINVGGASEVAMREKKDRVEDAVCACTSALKSGYLLGGGVSLMKASYYVDDDFHKVMCSVFNKLLENANTSKEYRETVYRGIAKSNFTKMYDVETMSFVDIKDAIIFDAYDAIKLAIESSVSIASTILSSRCIIYAIPEPPDKGTEF